MITKKKIIVGVIVSLIIAAAIMTLFLSFTAANKRTDLEENSCFPSDQLTLLYESISYSDGEVSFTIPEGDTIWNIYISGRIHVDGAGEMSIHYLEEESASNGWEGGNTYSFDVSGAKYSRFTELYIDAESDGEEISVDILEFLPMYLKMTDDSQNNEIGENNGSDSGTGTYIIRKM